MNLFLSLENSRELGNAFAWRIGEPAMDVVPVADRVGERKQRQNGLLDLVENELEVTPSTAPAASRTPRGKWRRDGAGSFR